MKHHLSTEPSWLCTHSYLIGFLAVLALTGRGDEPGADLVAHEWGTFTSIQGSDGELLHWNAVDTIDLPQFVYNWTRPGLGRWAANPFGPFGKQSYVALQRMETPVIYFHTKKPLTVNVSVAFPQGYITEWFPQAGIVGPSYPTPSPFLQRLDRWTSQSGVNTGFSFVNQFGEQPVTNSLIRWNDVRLLQEMQSDLDASPVPVDGSDNHYFAARETDANLLRVDSMEKTNRDPEFEKFLFYRGVGQFQTPLRVLMDGEDITVINTGPLPLKHLFAITVQNGRASFARLDFLPPSTTNVFRRSFTRQSVELETAAEQIAGELTHALSSEGLYAREAAAMVKTWRSAWLTEPGTRVLYVLPREWTDQILPIEIEPVPLELVRVMVGRAELITPAAELQVCECIELFRRPGEADRAQAVEQFQAIGLGRFASPAVERVIRQTTDPQYQRSAREMLQAVKAVTGNVSSTVAEQTSAGRPGSNGG